MQRTLLTDARSVVDAPPTVAVAAPGHWVLDLLPPAGFRVAPIGVTGGTAVWSPEVDPDLVVIDSGIGRRAWPALCSRLREDPRIANRIPILVLTDRAPLPDERVAALHAGAWGFLPYAGVPGDAERLMTELHAYRQARRRVASADPSSCHDPAAGVFRRAALARRLRELAALLARHHAALACVVLVWDGWTPDTIRRCAAAARVSDVLGMLSPKELAVVAPGTGEVGAVHLTRRLANALGHAPALTATAPAPGLNAGFDAVTNLTYTPIDPLDLLAHAGVAASSGRAVPECPWVRRFDPSVSSAAPSRRSTS